MRLKRVTKWRLLMSKGTVMILAGGTGGHVYPAIAVADEFKQQGFEIIWIGTKKGIEARLVPEHGFKIDWIDISGLRGNGFKRLLFAPLILLRAFIQMVKLFIKYKPVLVLGMGGFVAGPGGFVAKIMRCPLVIHEQNSIPGMTNKLLAKVANRVLTGFPNVLSQYKNTAYVGNPVRLSIKPSITTNKTIHVLVFGGSLGAKAINDVIPDMFSQLNEQLNKQGLLLNLQHQTGKVDYATVIQNYKKLGLDNNPQIKVSEYINDMDLALALANIAICRAGAMTVAELAMAGLPAIFIPYPHAVDDHQTTNALDLVNNNAGYLINQNDLTVQNLSKTMLRLCEQPEQLKMMAQNALNKAKPNATKDIVSNCLSVIKKQAANG